MSRTTRKSVDTKTTCFLMSGGDAACERIRPVRRVPPHPHPCLDPSIPIKKSYALSDPVRGLAAQDHGRNAQETRPDVLPCLKARTSTACQASSKLWFPLLSYQSPSSVTTTVSGLYQTIYFNSSAETMLASETIGCRSAPIRSPTLLLGGARSKGFQALVRRAVMSRLRRTATRRQARHANRLIIPSSLRRRPCRSRLWDRDKNAASRADAGASLGLQGFRCGKHPTVPDRPRPRSGRRRRARPSLPAGNRTVDESPDRRKSLHCPNRHRLPTALGGQAVRQRLCERRW